MNYLKDRRCYLGGPIQFCSGVNWREEPKRLLTEKFGIHLFDPFADPKQQWAPLLDVAKEKKDWNEIVRISKGFVRKDLCLVDRSDFIVSFLPYKVPTSGTVHEIINSNNAKKPTLLVTDKENIGYIPYWYFGFIPPEFMFAGWQSLFNYLEEVNDGKHRDNNRWSFVYEDV